MSNAVQAAILLSQGRHEEALIKVDEAVIARPTCDVTFALEESVRRYMGVSLIQPPRSPSSTPLSADLSAVRA